MTGRLHDRVVLVTGAGAAGPGWGIGKATAVQCAREGARVVAVDIDADAVAQTKEIIHDEGGTCATFVADVSNPRQVEAMVAACVEVFGVVDALVNNVAAGILGGLLDTSLDDWNRALQINITSMFLVSRLVVDRMLDAHRQDGRVRSVVNVGAVAGRRWTGVPMLPYATSKGAVEPFTRSVALEFARDGIRCNCVLPGLMDTPFIRKPLNNAYSNGDLDDMLAIRDEQAPTGRMGTAWDIAHAVVYLASSESDYVNGHALVVDGGQSAQTWSRPRTNGNS